MNGDRPSNKQLLRPKLAPITALVIGIKLDPSSLFQHPTPFPPFSTIYLHIWPGIVSKSSNMCFSATCPTCYALSGIPENQWCTCGSPIMIGGKAYPPAANVDIPGLSWLAGLFGGRRSGKEGS
ncbi:hypothetical protein F4775DRAFT_22485 [Biscogniauxia sp. FL1348]|nr:hypothetical protein F4775DRAFT_22485 [Biscogniauxia sp. FL1348]